MSVTATPTIKKTDAIDFPALFKIFCESKFGNWDKYTNSNTFRNIMAKKFEFGNLIFHDLVNFVSKVEQVPIKDLLHEFSDFIAKYY
ncbi:MAG: hypothetical protein D6732_29605 [Methanobacteriota archaeon]|nr:MAG: hypothetical protein D6732_29605 [Euryarchaeota archaeon]